MTTNNHKTCKCGGTFRLVDQHAGSFTVQCTKCEHCSLLVSRSRSLQAIFLADFHLKRGDADGQRSLDDLSMANQLVRCLINDEWPTPATIVDYGIDSARHLGSLQNAVQCGCTAYDLDRVMGDGPAITELVRSAPRQPYGRVEFQTVWDSLEYLQKQPTFAGK